MRPGIIAIIVSAGALAVAAAAQEPASPAQRPMVSGRDDAVAGPPALPRFGFEAEAREVMVVFRALDKNGRLVAGIEAQDIDISDEGSSRQITSFQANSSNAQVVVLADVSGSMHSVLEPLQGALFTFADIVSADKSHDAGDVLLSLIPFSSQATPLVDRTSNPAEFKDAVMRLRSLGSTALVDAVLASLSNAFGNAGVSSPGAPQSRTGKVMRSKFLVIFTDAGENASAHQWSEITSAVLGKDVVIYSIAFNSGAPESNFAMLSRISDQSGGRMYRTRADDLERIYTEIAKDVRSHYEVTFSVTGVVNSHRWRNIRVSTRRPGVIIYTRKGYCPKAPCQTDDGSFVGGKPKSLSDVIALSRDPSLVYALKQRLRDMVFSYGDETQQVARDLANDAILIEKTWNAGRQEQGRGRARPPGQWAFEAYRASSKERQVNIDAEICGIQLSPDVSGPAGPNVAGDPALQPSTQSLLKVLSPEVRIARRPRTGKVSVAADGEDDYFRSQVLFDLKDLSGRIPGRIRIQCNRPHFLISEELLDLAVAAVQQGLKAKLQ